MNRILNYVAIALSLAMVLLSLVSVTWAREVAIASFRRALVAEAIRPEGFARFVADDRFASSSYEMRGGLRTFGDPVDDPWEVARAFLPYQFTGTNYTQAIAWSAMAALLVCMRFSRERAGRAVVADASRG